eukprot:Seg2110.1 transcript_id=Seg2110.1/GoldUCD/mRNA.D3Y31 product="ETS domain-containing protein Elk-1" protein_id=Seg2110.1/GoldUCD/D3Y31
MKMSYAQSDDCRSRQTFKEISNLFIMASAPQEIYLLSNEDKSKILNDKDFDYLVEPTQENKPELESALISHDTEIINQFIDCTLESGDDIDRSSESCSPFGENLNSFLQYLEDENIEQSIEGTEITEQSLQEQDQDKMERTDEAQITYISIGPQLYPVRNEDRMEQRIAPKVGDKRELKEIQNDESPQAKVNGDHSKWRSRNDSPQVTRRPDDRIRLEDFLLEMLRDDKYSSYITWTYEKGREFKLSNARQVANEWGLRKNKKKFTHDKLLRELRNLRKAGKLEKMDRNDHFKFLKL